MKFHFSSRLFGVFAGLLCVFSSSQAILAAGPAVKLDLSVPTVVRENEAFDITVTALDKDGQIATDYRGRIIFSSDTALDATFPGNGQSNSFNADDEGKKVFSKGIIFKKAGKQKISVSDVENIDLIAATSIMVEPGVKEPNTTGEITLLAPTPGQKIANPKVMVAGNTRPQSKVKITINDTVAGEVSSDQNGLFSQEFPVSQEQNIVFASLLDADGNAIGTSEKVRFVYGGVSNGLLYGLEVQPALKVPVSTPIKIYLDAAPGLESATIMFDERVEQAKEIETGRYLVDTIAPAVVGEYDIDVTLKTALNGVSNYPKESTLITTAREMEAPPEEPKPVKNPAFRNVKLQTNEDSVKFSWNVENPPENLHAFKITYGISPSVLSQTIITDTAEKINNGGLYTWHIPNMQPGTYYFRLYGITESKSPIDKLESELLTATIGTKACLISNVGTITTKTDATKTVLTWEAVPEAIGYNIYKVEGDGRYTFFQKVKDPMYTIFLSPGAIKYETFGIKAICNDGETESDAHSQTRVQTGPVLVFFLLGVSGIAAALFLRRRSSL